jgi:hypothetical protein
VVHVGLDATRSDTVDSDLLLSGVWGTVRRLLNTCQILKLTDGHAAGEGLDGTLGAGVDGVLGDTLSLTGDRSHEDDTAANFHSLVSLLGNEELAASVDGHDTVVLLLSHILEVAERNDTRVGAADVELAEVLDDIVHQLYRLLDVANVGLEGMCVSSERLDFLDERLGSLSAVGIVNSNLGSSSSKLHSHLAADTTACYLSVTVLRMQYSLP